MGSVNRSIKSRKEDVHVLFSFVGGERRHRFHYENSQSSIAPFTSLLNLRWDFATDLLVFEKHSMPCMHPSSLANWIPPLMIRKTSLQIGGGIHGAS